MCAVGTHVAACPRGGAPQGVLGVVAMRPHDTGPSNEYDRVMGRSGFLLLCALAITACDSGSNADDDGSSETGGGGMDADDDGETTDDESSDESDSADSDSNDSGAPATCDELDLAPLDDDPDEGYIDVTEFCVELINGYRSMQGLEPYTVHADGVCCSAQEAHQAWLDDTHHNGDYCDWVAQGAAGGGRNPNGTATASMEWVPKLFYQEMGDTFEESGGHYQAMMRPEPRAIACGWYGSDRDNHRVVVNYW